MSEVHPYHNELSSSTKKSMKSRVLVALIFLLILLPLIILGDYFYLVGALILFGIAEFEVINAIKGTDKKFSIAFYIISYLTLYLPILFTALFNFLISNTLPFYDLINDFSSIYITPISLLINLIILITLALINKKVSLNDIIYIFFFNIILSLSLLSLLYLRFYPLYETLDGNGVYSNGALVYERIGTSLNLFIYVIIGICFNDIFAYFSGVLFGKHKMCPTISPKKTWEGFVGGVLGSFLFSFLFAILLAYFNYPIIEILDLNHRYIILIISLILPFVGTIGDLLFSQLKRHFGIKDFGTILKSHGGILDRIDSITLGTIVTAIILSTINLF